MSLCLICAARLTTPPKQSAAQCCYVPFKDYKLRLGNFLCHFFFYLIFKLVSPLELSVSNLLFDKTSRNKEILIRRLTDLSLADLITMHCTKPPGGISAIMYSTHSHSQIVNYDSLVRDLKLKVGRYFQYLSLQHSPQSSEAQRLLAMFVRSTSC